MNVTPLGCLVLVLAVAPATLAQTTEEVQPTETTPAPSPAPAPAPQTEGVEAKALREQLERETAARKAETDAAIAADIAQNPDGPNAQAVKKAADDQKAAELEKHAADEKTKADASTSVKAAADKQAEDRKAAAAAWAAGAAERDRAAAAQKAAVEKWRASGKPAPSILMSQRADGSFTVMVDGKISSFPTAAEAQAFVDKIRSTAETPSY